MKRLIAVLILSVFILTACILGNRLLFFVYNDAEALLLKCNESCKKDDWNAAAESAENLNRLWEKRKLLLNAFVNHGTLDNIERCITALKSYAITKSDGEFIGACNDALHLLKSLYGEQKMNIYSFL